MLKTKLSFTRENGIHFVQHLRCAGRAERALSCGEPFEQKPGDERDVSRYYDDLYFRTICAAECVFPRCCADPSLRRGGDGSVPVCHHAAGRSGNSPAEATDC